MAALGHSVNPDVIYPVRPGDVNEELRYSLRSLANLPHGRVWMVGHKPSWVRGVEFIAGNDAPFARANLYRNLWLACTHPDVSDDVVIFNDDFYVTTPVDAAPVLYRDNLNRQVAQLIKRAGRTGWWQESMAKTRAVLHDAGYDDPISYELHTPFPCDRHKMATVLARFADVAAHNPPQWRTLYGNVEAIGGQLFADCKALRPGPVRRPFHSTDDLSFRYFRGQFTQMFAEPSPYETPQADARLPVNVAPRRHPRRRTRA